MSKKVRSHDVLANERIGGEGVGKGGNKQTIKLMK
jgi:hypothetical protein